MKNTMMQNLRNWVMRLRRPALFSASLVLALAMVIAAILPPLSVFAVTESVYTLDNGYIRLDVSTVNAGFAVRAVTGDKLNKSDDNKRLLYHNGQDDTSFLSFSVTDADGKTRDYIFGGNYSFLGLGGRQLTVTRDATGIDAVWILGDLTFRQRLELANTGAAEHGMVYIRYKVENHGARPVKVQARVLLDTALGDQDYAVYQVVDGRNTYRSIDKETVLQTSDFIPSNFFAQDDPANPQITAYTVNKAEAMPYQVAFGHWNNLASTAFAFTPDPNMDFTNPVNAQFQTADSAYALYYDMGQIAAGQTGQEIATWYGVFSNQSAPATDRVTVNLTAPSRLELKPDLSAYEPAESGLADGVFSIQAQVTNLIGTGARDYKSVAVAVLPDPGIIPLNGSGNPLFTPPSLGDPYRVEYVQFVIGQTQSTRFFFQAEVGPLAQFRRVDLVVFNLPDTAGGKLLQENILGRKSFYILCPGSGGDLPEIRFTGATPQIHYFEGNRQMRITGSGFEMMADKSRYRIFARKVNSSLTYEIPSSQITFPEPNVMDLQFRQAMAEGDYTLTVDWSQPPLGIDKQLTAPVLRMTMSADRKYRADAYGVIGVVQLTNGGYGDHEYAVKAWRTESDYSQDKGNYKEVLLVFRGDLTDTSEAGVTRYSAVSTKNADGSVNGRVTVNNCLDFENGKMSIYTEGSGKDQKILVDFEGDLLTSIARTYVITGYAALTEISNGHEFDLQSYDDDGSRGSLSGQTISLIWAGDLEIAQTISGMVFNLSYGTFGKMGNDFVLSFSAALDLSFLVPPGRDKNASKTPATTQPAGSTPTRSQTGSVLRQKWVSAKPAGSTGTTSGGTGSTTGGAAADDPDRGDKSLKAEIEDILYGGGKGYLGFNCTVEVGLPSYSDSMPDMQGSLSINTIGGWAVGVQGQAKFTVIELEFEIGLIGYNNIPVPDKLYFYIGGFEPGINIDGCGVLWITGLGGGFENLYDTLFVSTGLPPLKLLLSASFDLLKILTARTDLSLSLSGISLKVSDVKIKRTDVTVLKKAVLDFQWLPNFNFTAAVAVDIFDGVISGGGYLVVVNDDTYTNFVEFFVRAALSIPSKVPVVGGMQLGGVDFGVNNAKIWGALTVIGIKLGVTYYWGGDVNFGVGDDSGAQPTFPDLLALNGDGHPTDVPILKDERTGRTLYMRFGSNLCNTTPTERTADWVNDPSADTARDDGGPSLLALANARVQSDLDLLRHRITLGTWGGQQGVAVLRFPAESLAAAQALAAQIKLTDTADLSTYPLTLYRAALANEKTANANLTYDGDTGQASLAISFAAKPAFDHAWSFTTPVATQVILYDVAPLPAVDTIGMDGYSPADVHPAGSELTVTYEGSMLRDLNAITYHLLPAGTTDLAEGIFLGSVSAADLQALAPGATKGSKTMKLPADLRNGSYTLHATYRSDALSAGRVESKITLKVSNADQPAALRAATLSGGGDLTMWVGLDDGSNPATAKDRLGGPACDGYLVSIYEQDASGAYVPTDFTGIDKRKIQNAEGAWVLPDMRVGGSYLRPASPDGKIPAGTVGLAAGRTYRVGVTPYNLLIGTDGKLVQDSVVGEERFSGPIVLAKPDPAQVVFINQSASKVISRAGWTGDATGKAVYQNLEYITFNSKNVSLTLSADQPVSGSWTLDRGVVNGDVTDTTVSAINLHGLSEGDHLIQFVGSNQNGDSCRADFLFTVDTAAPVLLLSTPAPGDCFGADGKVLLSGVADPESLMTIRVDGQTIAGPDKLTALGGTYSGDGIFSLSIGVPADVAYHRLEIISEDLSGNRTVVTRQIQHRGLADLSRVEVMMLDPANGGLTAIADGNIPVDPTLKIRRTLALVGITSTGARFRLNRTDAIQWQASAALGGASLLQDGTLTLDADSYGFLTGSLGVIGVARMQSAVTFGAERYLKPLAPVNPVITPKPTPWPTTEPTAEPTAAPSAGPTAAPTGSPGSTTGETSAPSAGPTAAPTGSPGSTTGETAAPSAGPTVAPTGSPGSTTGETAAPTGVPTQTQASIEATGGGTKAEPIGTTAGQPGITTVPAPGKTTSPAQLNNQTTPAQTAAAPTTPVEISGERRSLFGQLWFWVVLILVLAVLLWWLIGAWRRRQEKPPEKPTA